MTKAFTLEQKAQWQQAIRLLDYLDFHAISKKGIAESDDRLPLPWRISFLTP